MDAKRPRRGASHTVQTHACHKAYAVARRLQRHVRPARRQESVDSFRVCRKAVSTSVIGKVPITRSIATSATVARLSGITTESVRSPDRCPIGVATSTTTRLGWLARNRRLVIIATMTWGNPVVSCRIEQSVQDAFLQYVSPSWDRARGPRRHVYSLALAAS